ncbi:hypothetical protein BDQ17DRAFT_1285946 [Cyathus striatus]|nr:hypothetical protein BDQ17DRAFT_1285946 [Cyathus striatus]
MSRRPSITAEQAQRIVHKHISEDASVANLKELVSSGYSFSPISTTYIIDLKYRHDTFSEPRRSCWLNIAHPSVESGNYHTNFLPLVHELVLRVIEKTELPFSTPFLDITLMDIPYHFLIFPEERIASSDIISLSSAREKGLLTEEESVLIDLEIGKILGQLHSGVQNDWFGVPELEEPHDPSYSWQEVFTPYLESLLTTFQSEGLDLPYETIRGYLSRAIGSFLFDDVDVPSLIWFTGSEHDIYTILPSPRFRISSVIIAAVLPSLAHAIWGDPLLETLFMNKDMSLALMEGYLDSGGQPMLLFPRHQTKRIWYTLFLSLVVLRDHGLRPREDDEYPASKERRQWCKETITKCIELLKDAPCY